MQSKNALANHCIIFLEEGKGARCQTCFDFKGLEVQWRNRFRFRSVRSCLRSCARACVIMLLLSRCHDLRMPTLKLCSFARSRSLSYPHAGLLAACSLAGWLAHCLVPACPLTRPSTCSLARTLRWLACSCSARLSCSLRTLCKLSTLRMLRLLCLLCSLHLLTC